MVFCRGPSIRTQKNVWKWGLRKTVKVGARKGGGGGGGTSLVRKDENRENEDELEIVSQSQVGDLSKNSTSRCAQLAKLLLTLYLRLHCRTQIRSLEDQRAEGHPGSLSRDPYKLGVAVAVPTPTRKSCLSALCILHFSECMTGIYHTIHVGQRFSVN